MGEEFVHVGKYTCQIPLSLHKQYGFKKNLYIGLSVKCTCIPIFQFWWK